MNNQDVVVIGGGLAGLIAAAAAANRGKKVTVVSKGAGTLLIGSGTIDILGYNQAGVPLADPVAGFADLPGYHPYKSCGLDTIKQAVEFFKQLSQSENYLFTGDLSKNFWLPTAAGTLKPSCLIPQTMQEEPIYKSEKVIVLDFIRLKDYFPKLLAKELAQINRYKKTYKIVSISAEAEGSRDLTVLDIARWLESTEGKKQFICQFRKKSCGR